LKQIELELERLLVATFSAVTGQAQLAERLGQRHWQHPDSGDENRKFDGPDTLHRFAKLL
jgi:hypothetical protein